MKQLTKKRKIEIANAIIADSEYSYDALKTHRAAIRELIIKAIDMALSEAEKDEPA